MPKANHKRPFQASNAEYAGSAQVAAWGQANNKQMVNAITAAMRNFIAHRGQNVTKHGGPPRVAIVRTFDIGRSEKEMDFA